MSNISGTLLDRIEKLKAADAQHQQNVSTLNFLIGLKFGERRGNKFAAAKAIGMHAPNLYTMCSGATRVPRKYLEALTAMADYEAPAHAPIPSSNGQWSLQLNISQELRHDLYELMQLYHRGHGGTESAPETPENYAALIKTLAAEVRAVPRIHNGLTLMRRFDVEEQAENELDKILS